MSRWSSYLVVSLISVGLGAAFVPSVIAAPKVPGGKTTPSTMIPTKKGQVVGPVFSAKTTISPKDLLHDGAGGSPIKITATPTPRVQEIVAELSENRILARGVGKPTVVNPGAMFVNKYTHMRAIGDIQVFALSHSSGKIIMKRKSEWIPNQGMSDLVAVDFRAAADKHYVVDCLVQGDHAELYLSYGNEWIGGKAIHEGDHRIALLPKASTLRTITASVFNMTEGSAWAEVHQCELIPLRE